MQRQAYRATFVVMGALALSIATGFLRQVALAHTLGVGARPTFSWSPMPSPSSSTPHYLSCCCRPSSRCS